MKLVKTGIAGTMESGDILVEIEAADSNGISIDLDSTVGNQFGAQIKKVISDTVKSYGIGNAKIKAVDKGSLDCTICARVTAAIMRGCESADYKWN